MHKLIVIHLLRAVSWAVRNPYPCTLTEPLLKSVFVWCLEKAWKQSRHMELHFSPFTVPSLIKCNLRILSFTWTVSENEAMQVFLHLLLHLFAWGVHEPDITLDIYFFSPFHMVATNNLLSKEVAHSLWVEVHMCVQAKGQPQVMFLRCCSSLNFWDRISHWDLGLTH